ncbi:MAG: lysozyme inhibitor LprI family protein [Methyloligellaceae bacterium]
MSVHTIVLSYIITCLLLMIAPGTSWAKPSFNCNKATKPTEKAICDDWKLGSLDRELHKAFHAALKYLSYRKESLLREDQAEWLDFRNQCGYTKTCIARKYRNRIKELNEFQNSNGVTVTNLPRCSQTSIPVIDPGYVGKFYDVNRNTDVVRGGTRQIVCRYYHGDQVFIRKRACKNSGWCKVMVRQLRSDFDAWIKRRDLTPSRH